MNCPKCDAVMEQEETDESVGIVGGFYCSNCDLSIAEWERDEDQSDFGFEGR